LLFRLPTEVDDKLQSGNLMLSHWLGAVRATPHGTVGPRQHVRLNTVLVFATQSPDNAVVHRSLS
jgi:hypothetical protein